MTEVPLVTWGEVEEYILKQEKIIDLQSAAIDELFSELMKRCTQEEVGTLSGLSLARQAAQLIKG